MSSSTWSRTATGLHTDRKPCKQQKHSDGHDNVTVIRASKIQNGSVSLVVLTWTYSPGSAEPFYWHRGWEGEFPGQRLADWTVRSDWQFLSGPDSTGKGTLGSKTGGKTVGINKKRIWHIIQVITVIFHKQLPTFDKSNLGARNRLT